MRVQRTAYFHLRFDWLFSIYIFFAVAAIARYLWIGWRRVWERQADGGRTVGVGPVELASPFSICIAAITVLALFGLPVGYAMIAGSLIYLIMVGQDLGTVAEQPERRTRADPARDPDVHPRRRGDEHRLDDRTPPAILRGDGGRFRGGLAQVNVVQSIVFAGMSGSAIADAAGSGR